MQPSSLIFVLVVAIWAAYLLQYWIKRRDHLATVRSVDRFSAAMRVLDDHRMRRGAAEPAPRSYAVAPTRAARPEVTVKHAESPRHGHPAEPAAGASRRVRGLTLLTMLVLLPIVLLVTAFGPLPWWVSLAWLAGTAGAFAWLRNAVMAERAAARRRRAETFRDAERATAAPAEPTMTRRTAPVAAAPFDVADQAEEAAPAAEPSPLPPVSDPEPGTWQPTPVPRPMYTMKARAERPDPSSVRTETAAPAAPVDADGNVPQVIDVEDEDLPAIAGWG